MDSLSIPLPEHAVLQALLATTFTWLMTALGAATVFFSTKNVTKLGANLMLGFAGGVMLAASYWSLLAPAIQMSEHMGNLSWMPATIGFIAGALFLRFADMLLPHLHYYANVKEGPKSKFRRSTLLMFAVTLHNFPEGMATFIATYSDPALGLTLATAIAIHNVPEGIAVAAPVYAATGSRSKAFWWATASGLTEPIGGLIAAALVAWVIPPAFFGVFYGLVAGMMVFLALDELLPGAWRYQTDKHQTVYGMLAGMAVMALSFVLFA